MSIIRNFNEKTEQFVIEVMNGKRRGGFAALFRGLLFFLSRLYRAGTQIRLSLYNMGIMRQKVLGSFVISVGNLTTGGTGKTPVVELLAKTLTARGKRVAILSRGYRSKPRPLEERIKGMLSGDIYFVPPRLVSDGTQVLLNSGEAGDEPYMLARNLLGREGRPGAMVIVDRDRFKGGTFAIKNGADTMILDDGFQYLRLRPWINIMLVDSTNPFHNHEILPAGMLREPIKNMRRADYIFLTKSTGHSKFEHLKKFLKKHNPQAEIIECNHLPCYLEDVTQPGKTLPLEALNGKKIAAVSAIARPESFENYLTELKGTIVRRKHFADHHRYNREEIADFCRKAKEAGAEMILTTEKDAVRLPELPEDCLPFYFLRVEIKILSGWEHFEKCISQICLG